MDKRQLMKRLLPVIDTVNIWDRLEDYLTFERSVIIETLITSNDIKTINRLQGEILLIDKLLSLPEVIKKL